MTRGEEIPSGAQHNFSPKADIDLDEMIRISVKNFGSPSAIFVRLVADIPDDQLVGFRNLVEGINTIAIGYSNDVNDEIDWLSPTHIDLARAESMPDGGYRVPIADRDTLQSFLLQDRIDYAIETYYWDHLEDGLQPSDDAPDDQDFVAVESDIEQLPTNFVPLDSESLFILADTHYWSSEGRERNIFPADTLGHIAINAPEELVIPLLLAIEDRFSRKIDDYGHYTPVLRAELIPDANIVVENGIIWGVYGQSTLRSELEYACGADSSSDGFIGFDGESFNDKFYETLAHLSQSEADEFGYGAVENFRDEVHRRLDEFYI